MEIEIEQYLHLLIWFKAKFNFVLRLITSEKIRIVLIGRYSFKIIGRFSNVSNRNFVLLLITIFFGLSSTIEFIERTKYFSQF